MPAQPADIPVRVPVRLGQLLQLSGIADTGSDARTLVADGDVLVDGAPELRRGRQLTGGEIVEVRRSSGVESVRVVADGRSEG
ncbi:RNA-binding S4 domain-containing protein [Georgenia sp. Z1491]|uniref:RNA-binding S4 domain-containing protein n=1 Tax=Georgenia sp. Z1491 TaxID=3416707 RepID=UPI003CF58DE6